MAYAEFEKRGGRPVEMYKFVHGAMTWYWTSGDVTVSRTVPETTPALIETYTPEVLLRGAFEIVSEARTSNVQIKVGPDNEIASLFGPAQPDMPVLLTIFRGQRSDPDGEFVVVFDGQVKACTMNPDDGPSLVCGPIQDLFKRATLPVLYQVPCGNELYG